MSLRDLPKIDAHTHLFYGRPFLEPLLEAWNMRAVVINITGEGLFEEPMPARWQAMQHQRERHPDRFALCASFDPSGIAEADFAEKTVKHLRRRLDEGASLVKVWKDVGLMLQDADGSYVQIDDPRFQPVWDFLAAEDVPVLVHVAEPRAAWEPLDEESPHYRYYRDHPQHHLYQRDDVPSWEAIIEARDRWLAQNSALTVVGAHFGSMACDVDLVAERLDRFPNFYVDTAERFGDLVVQPSDDVRRFFMEYEDRILYGTDVIMARPERELTPDEAQQERANYTSLLQQHGAYFRKDEEIQVQDKLLHPIRVQALDLPDDVLRNVYYDNAADLYGLSKA